MSEKSWRARAEELAAVVEKVRSVIERESGWFRHRAGRVLDILDSAPQDVLREKARQRREEQNHG